MEKQVPKRAIRVEMKENYLKKIDLCSAARKMWSEGCNFSKRLILIANPPFSLAAIQQLCLFKVANGPTGPFLPILLNIEQQIRS